MSSNESNFHLQDRADRMIDSSPSLNDAYRRCVANYFLAVEEYGKEMTGEIENIALDGVFLILWAKVIGLHDSRINAQLKHFQTYMEQELSRFNWYFGLGAPSASDRPEAVESQTSSSKSNLLKHWMSLHLSDYKEIVVPAADDARISNTFRTTFAPLRDLCTASDALRKALPRILSESQKAMLDRAFKRYEGIILSEVGVTSSSPYTELHPVPHDRDEPTISLLGLRIDTYVEEQRIEALTLQKLEFQAMNLERAIGLNQPRPETLRVLSVRHEVGRYEEKLVFIEKRRNHGWTAEGQKAIEIFLRINKLVARLAKGSKLAGLCTLDCLKYFSDRQDKEYSIVYAWPWELKAPISKEIPRPQALHEVLKDIDNEEYKFGPSLTLRVKIAQRIAKCVETFHLCGWLHKSINSHNVIIFPDAQQEEAATFSAKRFFLVGFEYSRPDGMNNITEPITTVGEDDIYRHPDATSFEGRPQPDGSVFEKKHDLYALGLLLIEIALWQRLEEILESDLLPPPQLSKKFRGRNLRSLTPRERHSWLVDTEGQPLEALIKFSAGEQYTKAVMACLREEVREGVDYGGDVYNKVIEPLTHCTV